MALFESAIGGTAVSIVEQAVKAGKYAAKEIRGAYSEVDHAQRMIAASNAYIDNYLNRHCQIKIMPGLMKEPLDLESIYTDVKILDDRSIRAFLGPDELESAYREKGARRFGGSEAERINGMTVANAERFLMVLGGPGIGKSTFLRKIGLEALKKNGRLERACIPVFLELKKFREETIDIQQKIVEEFDTCKFPSAAAFVDSALEQGKLLVLFDGLDEVPSKQLNQVIEKIENFVDKHDKNSFVASCRTAAYRSSFHRFTDVTISEFDDEQIKQFIHRWFSSEEDRALETAEKYEGLLNQPDHKATKELAQTPLLLTFLCLVYDREQMLPNKRSTLYGQALNIILSEWSAQKRLERDPIYEGFHPDLEKEMLSEIAYKSFKQDQLFFSKDIITDQIRLFLSDTLDAPKGLNANNVLRAIEVQQGILVERATDAYSFSHLTLQEYLTSLYIVENRLEDELVSLHLTDDRWREIFLLVAGLTKSPVSRLLSVMNRKAFHDYLLSSPKLQSLITWAAMNKAGASELSQRATLIAIVLAISVGSSSEVIGDVDGVPIVKNSLVNNARAIANDIALATKKDKNITCVLCSAGAVQTMRAMADGFGDGMDIVSFSDTPLANSICINIDSNSSLKHHLLSAQSLAALAAKLSNHAQTIPLRNDVSFYEWDTWVESLRLIWIKSMRLDSELSHFFYKEAELMTSYLYAIDLVICCKQSAVRVSRTAWEELEAKLLICEEVESKI